MFDRVRVKQGRRVLKEGIIVCLTNCGAKVYDNSTMEYPFTDSAFHAEWFAFNSAAIQMIMIRPDKAKD